MVFESKYLSLSICCSIWVDTVLLDSLSERFRLEVVVKLLTGNLASLFSCDFVFLYFILFDSGPVLIVPGNLSVESNVVDTGSDRI